MQVDIYLSYDSAKSVADSFIKILNGMSMHDKRQESIYSLYEPVATELFQALAQAMAKPFVPPPPSEIQIEQER